MVRKAKTTQVSQETRALTTVEQKYFDFMSKLSLNELRVIGRNAGVPSSTILSKEQLIQSITDIYTGKTTPQPPSKRGAPAKSVYIAPQLLKELDDIRKECEESFFSADPKEKGALTGSLSQPEVGARLGDTSEEPAHKGGKDQGQGEAPAQEFKGILEITQSGYGFVRVNNCQPALNGGDAFVSASIIHSLRLREGDVISCMARPRAKSGSAAVEEIMTINDVPTGNHLRRPNFDNLTAQYATEKIALSKNNATLSLRMLDLFVPIGKGQRALIIAPPKAGKTTLLKDIARSISEHHKDITLIVLLIDERPEEVTDIRMSVSGAEVVYSTFDEGAEHHVRAASLTLAHAKRLAELGKDVVILLDSLTKLTRAYNNVADSSGKTLSGGLEASALTEPKRFFGAARNTVEAGSVTILATALVDTGSRMDDVIYEEFKGTGNADIFLSRDLAERRIFPAIDIRKSGTRKEELLLTKEEVAAVYKMRERGLTENVGGLIDMMKRTTENSEFVARLPEWMRIYKNVT